MRNIQVNVSLKNKVFKYSIDPKPPTHTDFVHDFHVDDQIRWQLTDDGHHLQVAFEKDICPFALANGTQWPNRTATFPGAPSQFDRAGFDQNRLYSRIKYSVTIFDAAGAQLGKDDPEVIIVDGG